MKKLIAVTGVILIGCVFAGSLASPPAVADVSAVSAEKREEERYLVKDCEGKIAVYRKGEQKPFMTTGTYTLSLPRSDSKKLQKGIEVAGKAALQRVLEDYCS